MPLAKSRFILSVVPPVLALSLLWYMPGALAEGGFPEPGFVLLSQRDATTSHSTGGEAVSSELGNYYRLGTRLQPHFHDRRRKCRRQSQHRRGGMGRDNHSDERSFQRNCE